MDLGRFLVEAHLSEGRPVAELAANHGVHRSWIYKLLARYRAEGPAGLKPRSRRPKSSPTAVPQALEEEIIELRKQLTDEGLDAGAVTIHWHLSRGHDQPPSVSSIWRILRRRGFVVPQPHKRPASSLVRFEAALPNELWQSDITHWHLADGSGAEIINFLDDHSRLCPASTAVTVATSADVVETFHQAAENWGYPAQILTDNGAVYTARYRKGRCAFETELAALGIEHKHARPYHPQTCGKVERFHQTLKKYLTAQHPAATIEELQQQLDRFADHYNHRRPHRALNRHTPAEIFDSKLKAHPPNLPTDSHYRIRRDRIDQTGKVTIRYRSRLHHIGIGRRHAGTPVIMLTADRDIRIIATQTGELLRQLQLDPTRNYQPQQP